MAFLNPVEAGGATHFTEVGITIEPKPGVLLVWNNALPDGTPTDRSVPVPLRGVSTRVGLDHEDTQRVNALAAGEAVVPSADEEDES